MVQRFYFKLSSNRYDQAQHYDGNISIPGCDKNMPGCFMAAVRHNRPTIIIYGGTIQPGVRHIGMLVTRDMNTLADLLYKLDCPSMNKQKGGSVNISDAFESYGLSNSFS